MLNHKYEPDGSTRVTEKDVDAARLVVAGHSTDADDLAMLLSMLGIGKRVDAAILMGH